MFNFKNLFRKRAKPKSINSYLLVCNMCIYDDETCSMCPSCRGRYHAYPSNFIARKIPRYEVFDNSSDKLKKGDG